MGLGASGVQAGALEQGWGAHPVLSLTRAGNSSWGAGPALGVLR
jgi:hypothetical protein